MSDGIAKCYSCGTPLAFQRGEYSEDKMNYPCGICPATCPNCGKRTCPFCGGELNVESDNYDIQLYCGQGCECGYEHCGGCI